MWLQRFNGNYPKEIRDMENEKKINNIHSHDLLKSPNKKKKIKVSEQVSLRCNL